MPWIIHTVNFREVNLFILAWRLQIFLIFIDFFLRNSFNDSIFRPPKSKLNEPLKRKYLLFFPVFLMLWSVSAQKINSVSKDSLDALFESIKQATNDYEYNKAIDNSYTLINLSKEAGNDYYVAQAYNWLGHSYLDIKDRARALKNYKLGLEYAKKVGNDTILLNSYNNLGNIYSEEKETVEKGIEYYNIVIDLAEKINSPIQAIIPKSNIGWTYLDNGQYERAFPYINESLIILNKERDTYKEQDRVDYFYAQLYMLHGRYYAYKGDFDKATIFFKRSIDLGEERDLIIPLSEAYDYYSKMLRDQGMFEEAYAAKEKYEEYNSQIFEAEKLRQQEIANAQFNLNEYRKDLEIAEREQKLQGEIIEKSKEKVVVMVLSSLGLIFILIFLHKVNRDRQNLIGKLKDRNKQYKEAKEEAEKLSLLKTKFFSTVSHEIRTPLYGVIGLTSLLLEDKSLVKHKADLRSLKFSADYLLALINDVLQMNKMESNEVKLESSSFNLRDLINSIMSSFEFTRIQNKNEVKLDIDENIPAFLIGDSVRLSQVLMNLVGNAMKFTERGLVVLKAHQVGSTAHETSIYFEVKDNGPGIPESKKKVVFEEFSQLSNSNYNYQGTGLGLPIVKKLLKLFGSKIYLESEEGVGSEFSFTITFKTDKEKKQVAEVREQVSEIIEENRKILIVDDNRINQVVTTRVLKKKDFLCEIASDGQEAIEKVKHGDFDLVLMDVNMPGISGLDASMEIRKFNKHVPILALTAVEVEEIREEILAAGMNDIIVKPYDIQQFYQVVYKQLNQQLVTEKV